MRSGIDWFDDRFIDWRSAVRDEALPSIANALAGAAKARLAVHGKHTVDLDNTYGRRRR